MTRETEELPPDDLPLLRGLTPTARAGLLRKAVSHSVATGTVLFEQGELPTFQHIVLAGSAHLFARSGEGREVLIEIVRPGDLVIPAAVVTASPYLMQARVLEPSRFLLIQADFFRAAVGEDSALARGMIASLAGQFRRMVRQIKNLKLRSSTERVGAYILSLSRAQKNRNRVTLPYEKNLIASELGMTRENFSRTLSALQSHGIAVKGNTILIADPRKLAAISGPDPLIDG
jgi:CRP/FNR family transcriptional regulator, transcriptional activator FtrB